MKPIVAIVGRPNVGKSTLFNRLIQQRLAIIEDRPGITRDRIYADTEWNGRSFTLVDTGGILPDAEEELTRQIKRQAELAIAEADLILFVLDTRAGITASDEEVAGLLRRVQKPVVLVANKVENLQTEDLVAEFYRLGLGSPISVSAIHGMGTGDLLDRVVELLPQTPEATDQPEEDLIRIAVIGRPNVGKSSLVNRLLGQERVIVSDIPGTTRDAVDVPIRYNGRDYTLVDTAGMRRKARIDEPVEHYSVLRTLRAVDRADVVLTLINAQDGVTEQDKRIAGYAHEAGKGQILVINKWDLLEKDEHTLPEFEERTRAELTFLDYAPRLFISAKTGQRLHRILPLVDQVYQACRLKVPTPQLNRVVEDALTMIPPPSDGSRRLKVHYATQGGVQPPVFLLFCNFPDMAHFSYQRYLENRIRQAFPLEGTPIKLVFKKKD